ncbi:hypothetical protein KR059_005961 [Drosophila kikkawai]|nr:hypothetical protein KR059_005961 [Drosophila kikkawai]
MGKKLKLPKQAKVKSFFRSEDMELCQLLLHVDNAFDCLMELGHHGMVQFNNIYDEDRLLNNLYTKKVVQCHEYLRLVDSLHQQIIQLNVNEIFYPNVDREDRMRERDLRKYEDSLRRLHLEASTVMEHYQRMDTRRYRMMEQCFAITKANKFMTADRGSELLYSESTIGGLVQDASVGNNHVQYGSQLSYLLGTIRAEKFHSFELLVYRMCSFNVVMRFAEMPKPIMVYTSREPEKVRMFTVLMMSSSSTIWHKVLKICAQYQVHIHDCPSSANQRTARIKELTQEIRNIERVLKEAELMRRQVLEIAARDLFIVRVNLRKALRVYDLMNRLRLVGGVYEAKYLLAEVYLPVSELANVRDTLVNANRLSGGADRKISITDDKEEVNDNAPPLDESAPAENKQANNNAPPPLNETASGDRNSQRVDPMETLNFTTRPIMMKKTRTVNHMPPTFFRLNKFTRGFQALIDAYGNADYQELNPAPYTIITFPFLFAVMFGDMGHGILLILFALLMIWRAKQIEIEQVSAVSENEIMNILFAGRYIILLMGIFSVYMGFIYNIVLSKSMNLFGSSWSCRYNASTVSESIVELSFDPSSKNFYTGNPYPIGMDPVWVVCGQVSITTTNSLKMKMAIILGVSQMMFGLCLSAANCVLLKKYADLLLVVVPQMIFLVCLFCYLCFLIFFKWLTYGGLKEHPYTSSCAPSVLITFINMMLMKKESPNGDCPDGMFPGERTVEYVLVILALLAVPVLLAGKPLYIMRRRKKAKVEEEKILAEERRGKATRQPVKVMRSEIRYYFDETVSTEVFKDRSYDQEDELEMSEIWIHSCIHTIETVLGSISHTASYLRLWALSLAHDQLSEVLWHMILSKGLANNMPLYYGVPILMATFFFWATLTVAILLMMEGLSAFLHTLRLHWVEFQSKFFNGSGEIFRPFSFPPSNHRS